MWRRQRRHNHNHPLSSDKRLLCSPLFHLSFVHVRLMNYTLRTADSATSSPANQLSSQFIRWKWGIGSDSFLSKSVGNNGTDWLPCSHVMCLVKTKNDFPLLLELFLSNVKPYQIRKRFTLYIRLGETSVRFACQPRAASRISLLRPSASDGGLPMS